MLSSPLHAFLRNNVRIMVIIWIAFQVAAAVYYGIARIIGAGWTDMDRTETGIAPLFYAVAAITALASILYQRWAFTDARLAASLERDSLSGSPRGAVLKSRPGYADLDESDRRLINVFGYVQTSYIVVWAMQEAVAIYGLVMAIVIRDVSNVVLFNLVALALLVSTRPAPVPLLERAARLGQRGGSG
jgi:Ni/Fe-hydrogenase subunit HybB-like protein